jgi:hypothetical protein
MRSVVNSISRAFSITRKRGPFLRRREEEDWTLCDSVRLAQIGERCSDTILALDFFKIEALLHADNLGLWPQSVRDGGPFIVHADEVLTAFLELQSAINEFAVSLIV